MGDQTNTVLQEKQETEGDSMVLNSAKKGKIRPVAFFVPVLLFIAAIILNFVSPETFSTVINAANNWVMGKWAWAFDLGVTAMVFVMFYLMFSRFGDVRIGGRDAQPFFTNFQYFSVTLTSIIAIGILFWGTAEPLYHYTAPPESLGIAPNSPEAAIFAISTLYLHWGITPLAIYAVPTIMFAFAFYNMKKPYSLASTLVPLLGDKANTRYGQAIDATCMYALVAGIAACLGGGILSVAGGVNYLTGIQAGAFIWLLVDAAIVLTFVISSITGLFDGIKNLSEINTFIFLGLVALIFIFGPIAFMLNIGVEAFGNYMQQFFTKSLFTGAAAADPWGGWWTIFYWCNWLAWAPISGMFLGRISYGRTIRKALVFTFILPALFDMIWMLIFGAATLKLQMDGVDIAAALAKGAEYTVYAVLDNYPLVWLTVPVFIFAMFISFVTGTDAYTTTLGAMSLEGVDQENPEAPVKLKVFWGLLIGTVAWVMIVFAGGVNGMKMLSNLGGLPALFLELMMMYCLIKVSINPSHFDTYKADYNADGSPIKSLEKPVHRPVNL